MMADEEEEAKQVLQKLQELVDQLYSFRESYFETHSVEDAGRKQQDVQDEMEKTVQQMEEVLGMSTKENATPPALHSSFILSLWTVWCLVCGCCSLEQRIAMFLCGTVLIHSKGSVQGEAQALMLKGKALNVTPEYSPEAEVLLSKAVKLEPELVEAWNQLGEVYWKKGDVAAAHTCFSGALTHCKNKVSLQNLSMVLRQLQTDSGDEHSRHVMDSVRQAKLAVQMDVLDGRSWYILGNAYLSLYFNTGQNPKISQQALSAYAQAEKVDRKASSNPDLHLNRATLHKYEESYGEALEGFSQAAALDPAWPEPRQREQQLLEFLTRLTSLLESKGKTKPKKLQSMLGSLRPAHLGPCGDGRYQSASGQKVTLERKPLSTLQPGVNSGTVVLGKVVFSLTSEEKVPLHHHIRHKGKDYSFSSVRVETPLLLVVNGKPQNSSSQATATVASRPQCE
ncbi:tetratricopeptide repeat protein 5 [Cricetulus griseus]|uniref:Tetratricopeptide repeat protein 5 n=2 Tax=Cricetulus griseus TaxID=10029 RepID=A0A061INT7_CRIGR|nr:tetratricopeptide repeat protein 5 [Cricetulus griseus]